MKPFAPLLGCLLLALSGAALSASTEGSAHAAPSCGEWVAHREKSDTLALGNAYWLQGYLFGMAAGSGKDILAGADTAAFNGWVDKYCHANPLKDLSSGGSALAAELLKSKRPTQ